MRKILLLQPPVRDFYDTAIRLQPVGLCSLKAAVGKYLPACQVEVRDYHQGRGRTTMALPDELAYLRDYYAGPDRSPFCTFSQYSHFGASFETIAGEVAAARPDLVGISSLFTPYYREVLACAAAIRRKTNVPIMVGGSHVSCAPQSILAAPCVDYIVRGEGERPFVEFLAARQRGAELDRVPNLGFKKAGGLILNPLEANFPLRELPPPDYTDLPVGRYLYGRRPVCFLLTSRGCPHGCAFCSVHLTFGRRYRRRSPESIVREMEERYGAGYRVFDFEDDNLTFDLAAVKEMCRLIIRRFAGCDLELLAMNGISYASLDEESLALMRQAGFTHLNLALVSADQSVLTAVRRPHTVEKFIAVVAEAARLGFSIVAHQILGLPRESLASMIETLALLARQPLLIGVSVFYLTPGAPIAAEFPEMTATDFFLSRSTAMAIETEHCRRDQLFTLFVTARILNFLKGLQVANDEAILPELLAGAAPDRDRTGLGLSLLATLLAEKQLYAVDRNGRRPVTRFDPELFFRVWAAIGTLTTQDGRRIHLRTGEFS